MTDCSVDSCTRPRKNAKNLFCEAHYRRSAAGRPLDAPMRTVDPDRGCSVDGCDRPHRAHGFCQKHDDRFRKGTPIDRPTRDPEDPLTWPRHVNKDGYAVRATTIHSKQVRILEHRHIMELHLGRPLRPEETVHHKHGARSDNRIEKLELWSSSQPPGQRVEDKVEWAKEILALYDS